MIALTDTAKFTAKAFVAYFLLFSVIDWIVK